MSLGSDVAEEMMMAESLYYLKLEHETDWRIKLLKCGLWSSKAGNIPIAQMSFEHIRNTIAMLRRNANSTEHDTEFNQILRDFAIPIFQLELKRRGFEITDG